MRLKTRVAISGNAVAKTGNACKKYIYKAKPINSMQRFSWKARFKSFTYAWAGIITFIKSEHNAWIHLAATLLAITAGFVFAITQGEWIAISGCITLVWVAEMVNTAIEKAMNHLSPERSEAVKDIKDIASGAVLVAAIFAAVTGAIIFLPKLCSIAGW